MLPDRILSKPWARPPIYTDNPASDRPDSEPIHQPLDDPSDQPAPMPRSGGARDAAKPPNGSTDNTPMDYRPGNPRAAFEIDDEDEV